MDNKIGKSSTPPAPALRNRRGCDHRRVSHGHCSDDGIVLEGIEHRATESADADGYGCSAASRRFSGTSAADCGTGSRDRQQRNSNRLRISNERLRSRQASRRPSSRPGMRSFAPPAVPSSRSPPSSTRTTERVSERSVARWRVVSSAISSGAAGGRTAMTLLGALGGGLAGNSVEKHLRSETDYSVHARMENGHTRYFTYKNPPPFAQGQRVHIQHGVLVAS